MPSIQVDLSDIESQIVEIFKGLKGIRSKKQALKSLILEHKNLIDKLKEEEPKQ